VQRGAGRGQRKRPPRVGAEDAIQLPRSKDGIGETGCRPWFSVPNGSSHTAASWKLCLDGSKVLTYHAAMETLSRRRFIQTAAGAAALGFVSPGVGAQRDAGFRGPLCFFSKHLPRMNGRELGRSLKALGFDGVDLTGSPG